MMNEPCVLTSGADEESVSYTSIGMHDWMTWGLRYTWIYGYIKICQDVTTRVLDKSAVGVVGAAG